MLGDNLVRTRGDRVSSWSSLVHCELFTVVTKSTQHTAWLMALLAEVFVDMSYMYAQRQVQVACTAGLWLNRGMSCISIYSCWSRWKPPLNICTPLSLFRVFGGVYPSGFCPSSYYCCFTNEMNCRSFFRSSTSSMTSNPYEAHHHQPDDLHQNFGNNRRKNKITKVGAAKPTKKKYYRSLVVFFHNVTFQ